MSALLGKKIGMTNVFPQRESSFLLRLCRSDHVLLHRLKHKNQTGTMLYSLDLMRRKSKSLTNPLPDI
jgi:hypothetical protein